MDPLTHKIKTENKPCIIITNYGDDSLALIQWAFENSLTNVFVVYIDTGWSANCWKERVLLGEQYVQNLQFNAITITAPISFSNAILGRMSFPSQKFAWCTGILKGLPLLDWLDEIDLAANAVILMAKRKAAMNDQTLAESSLTEWIQSSDHHNGRSLWHPLLNMDDEMRDDLLSRAGFKPLGHRSLECHPCVFSTEQERHALDAEDIKKLTDLEETLQQSFFQQSDIDIKAETNNSSDKYLDQFYRGCGNHFACGL